MVLYVLLTSDDCIGDDIIVLTDWLRDPADYVGSQIRL